MGWTHIAKFKHSILRSARGVNFLPASPSESAVASRNPRRKPDSTRPAEKLGELGDPGSQRRVFRKQSLGFLLVADPPQSRQLVGERRFFLLGIPGADGEAKKVVAGLVEP